MSRRNRGVLRWLRTSAKPTRARMPAARAAAASRAAFATQNPDPRARHALARKVSGDLKSQ
jgi:hypothetical protein